MAKPWLMGRQSAGNGFLRAAVAARGDSPLVGYGPNHDPGDAFAAFVQAIDPTAKTRWIATADLDAFNALGVCYRPDPMINAEARLRLRVGPARHSLCGVTHTIASAGAMDELSAMLAEPLMPWDAIICTSEAVAKTVHRVHEAAADQLRWRFGGDARIAAPQLPVIPLGVHCADFAFSAQERADARAEFQLSDGEVMALFVGRLAFVAKAHPVAMYRGLQAAVERTGQRVTLVQCGWSPRPIIAEAYESGAAEYCPDVRCLFVDGRDPASRRRCWAAADLFISLSDNIQETFGLTPLEAMAAGLPVVVTDWDGYRQTVRDGLDGFRVKTWALPAGLGSPIAKAWEAGALDYDRYCWAAASTTSPDLAELTDRLTTLIERPDLRRQMGDAGRRRARELFEWSHVFEQYQALWGELNRRRLAVTDNPAELAWVTAAPKAAASRLDPFEAFGHYPSATLSQETIVTLAPRATLAGFRKAHAHTLFVSVQAPVDLVTRFWPRLEQGAASVHEISEAACCSVGTALFAVASLAKMGFLRIGPS